MKLTLNALNLGTNFHRLNYNLYRYKQPFVLDHFVRKFSGGRLRQEAETGSWYLNSNTADSHDGSHWLTAGHV